MIRGHALADKPVAGPRSRSSSDYVLGFLERRVDILGAGATEC